MFFVLGQEFSVIAGTGARRDWSRFIQDGSALQQRERTHHSVQCSVLCFVSWDRSANGQDKMSIELVEF